MKPVDPALQAAFDRGLAVRREVLGKEYVDKALENADDFIYCGAPAALESFRIAKEVFAEDGV